MFYEDKPIREIIAMWQVRSLMFVKFYIANFSSISNYSGNVISPYETSGGDLPDLSRRKSITAGDYSAGSSPGGKLKTRSNCLLTDKVKRKKAPYDRAFNNFIETKLHSTPSSFLNSCSCWLHFPMALAPRPALQKSISFLILLHSRKSV